MVLWDLRAKKNAVFWDVPRRFITNRRFGTCHLYLQGRRNLTLFVSRVIPFTLKIEAIRCSETSPYNMPTRRHIPGDGILGAVLLAPDVIERIQGSSVSTGTGLLNALPRSPHESCCLHFI
jgi:hypothetical protein